MKDSLMNKVITEEMATIDIELPEIIVKYKACSYSEEFKAKLSNYFDLNDTFVSLVHEIPNFTIRRGKYITGSS